MNQKDYFYKDFINWLKAAICVAILISSTAFAQTESSPSDSANVDNGISSIESEPAHRVRKLLAIKLALDNKREQVRKLLEQLDSADEASKNGIRKQINELRQSIDELTGSFEYFAVNGVNLGGQNVGDDAELDWRDELVQIARPILDSLKEATEKPRKIEELRRSIQQYEQQLVLADKGQNAIDALLTEKPQPVVASGLAELTETWEERRKNIERSLEIARSKLQILEGENTRLFETTGRVLHEFFIGRGLTLLLAILVALAIWLVMRGLRQLVKRWRKPRHDREHAARVRLLLYVYHLMTMIVMSLSVLSVFYLRGDLLLLSLGLVALAMLILSAWRFLPGYIVEARLLLNMGSAREGERVVYNGLPFRIARLNLYSELHNPELEGSIRLPLSTLAEMISRPGIDEPWFPTRNGDYLLLADGSYAQVLQQTVETVQLRIAGKTVQYASADFLQMSVQNLSQDGFGVIEVFGIDYQHQAISLNRVPERLKSGLQSAFDQSEYAEDLKGLVVDFKSAASNSLDYLIYATMDGRVAASYFNISRLIQKTCVDICNEEEWVIPFAQLTIHHADSSVVE